VRVLARLFAMEGEPKSKANQERLWAWSAQLVKSASCASSLNQGLMELGATICTPRQPLCGKCPVRRSCAAFRLGQVAEFPQLPVRVKPRLRKFVAYVFRSGKRFLVRKRAAEVVNGNLWEFPNFEVGLRHAGAEKNMFPGLELRSFATIKHTITKNRITLSAKTAEVNGQAAALAKEMCGEWRTLRELETLPFSSAHAKLRGMLAANPRRFLGS
jgi:A/G-specific adenine glycosylase